MYALLDILVSGSQADKGKIVKINNLPAIGPDGEITVMFK